MLYNEPGSLLAVGVIPENSSALFPDLLPSVVPVYDASTARDCAVMNGTERDVCAVFGHIRDRDAHLVRHLHHNPAQAARRLRSRDLLEAELTVGFARVWQLINA
jgi:hypothetical protein